MKWNPAIYNAFESKRSEPFHDAIALILVSKGLKVLDLGCGTGTLTAELLKFLPESTVLGIDSSPEMLEKALTTNTHGLTFELRTIEAQLDLNDRFDLIFSNAALQWLPDHPDLFVKIIRLLTPGGQLVVQMPSQRSNITNLLLEQLAEEAPFNTLLSGWKRPVSLLSPEQYAELLFENGGSEINVMEKIYPLILNDTEELYKWVSGTALIPFLQKLDEKHRRNFIERYKNLLQINFKTTPVFYPFKRIILSAKF